MSFIGIHREIFDFSLFPYFPSKKSNPNRLNPICVQLRESADGILPIPRRISAVNGNIRDIVKSIEKFKFEQNQRKNEIENKNEFIPNTGSVE